MTQPSQGDVSCPSCATPNRAGAKYCRRCGATLPAPSAPSGPADRPATPPTMPIASATPPAADPPRRGFPWLLLFAAAAVALLLLAACVGGALWLLAGRSAGASPTPAVVHTVVADPTATAADTPTPAPADATPTVEEAPTPTPRMGVSHTPTADATAQAAAVAERQTAMAAALATSVPTPAPTAIAMQPTPGTLALPDYQAAVAAYTQRLFETFDRGERTKAIWTQFENDSVRARLRNNFYALTLKGPDKNMWETWDRDLGDTYNVELAVAFETTGVPATVGIAFDVQPDGDNGVFFEVYNDRHWQLRTVQDGRLVPEQTTDRIPLPELQDGVGTNVLWVIRRPDGVQLWINSTHVATVPAGPFAGGRAGVIASSREGLAGAATVIADNFRVRTP